MTSHYRWVREQHRAEAIFDRVEFADQLSTGRLSVQKANDVPAVRSRTIRTLLASQLAFPETEDLSTEQRVELRDKSVLSVQELLALSRSTWRSEPSAWIAAMGVGAGEFLAGLRSKGGIQRTPREQWFAPLTEAQSLAPSRGEVEGYLALALLEIWGDLSSEERHQATATLSKALEIPRFRAEILPRWTRLQHDYDDLVSILPDSLIAWQSVLHSLQSGSQWRDVVKTKVRLRELRQQESQKLIRQGERFIGGGEVRKGSHQLGLALGAISPENDTVAVLVQVLRTLPPGPMHRVLAPQFTPWLIWANRQCALAVCPVPKDAMNRLAGIVDNQAEQATAYAILTHTQSESALSNERWGLHWLTLLQTSERNRDDAAQYAAQVDGKWRRTAAFIDAANDAGVVDLQYPTAWSPTDWIWSGSRAYLSVVATAQTQVEVSLNSSDRGGVATLWLDGDWVAFPVVRGQASFTLSMEPGNHLIEFKPERSGEVTPGSVQFGDNAN